MLRRVFLNNTKAFTLAEVLITLTIIGVVTALTLPALIRNFKTKILETQFKQAYTDLNEASRKFLLNNEMTVNQYAYENSSSKKALSLFSKEFYFVGKTSSLTWNSYDDEGNQINAAPYKWKAIKGANEQPSNCNVSGFFWDTKGRVISFDDWPKKGYNGPYLCIDINGEKEPNRWGVDYFMFLFTTDGYVIPAGQDHKDNNPTEGTDNAYTYPSTYCKYSSSKTYQYACAYYASINKHPEDDDKDYWHDFINGK